MGIADDVRRALDLNPDVVILNSELAEADRLADLFSDVKPVAFIVPIERFVGLPYEKSQFAVRPVV